jgi:serine/threonine-protein kinase
VFRSERDRPGIWWRSADGAGDAERLTETSGPIHSPYSWTPDGRTLLLALFHSYGHQEIASVTPPDPTVRVELDGAFAQLDAQVSPDGRWLAYQSDETGRFEIYVRPFPDLRARRWQVSTRGGMAPRWHPHGGELYYYDGAGLTAVAVESNGEFRVGPSRSLFSLDWISTRLGPDYDVAPDGERFLFIRPVRRSPGESPTDLVYVRHFLAELTRRPPASR